MTTQHPNIEEIAALALGDLTPPQAAALEARISREPEARRLLDHLRSLVQTLASDDGAVPPAELIRRVKAMVNEVPAALPLTQRLREVVATLVFDSFGKVAVAGFRGGLTARQLAYSSDAGDVDVQVSCAGAARSVRGQVTPSGDEPASEVSVSRPGDASAVASSGVDAHGQFVLESPPGTFDLRIRVGDTLVVIPSLNLE